MNWDCVGSKADQQTNNTRMKLTQNRTRKKTPSSLTNFKTHAIRPSLRSRQIPNPQTRNLPFRKPGLLQGLGFQIYLQVYRTLLSDVIVGSPMFMPDGRLNPRFVSDGMRNLATLVEPTPNCKTILGSCGPLGCEQEFWRLRLFLKGHKAAPE